MKEKLVFINIFGLREISDRMYNEGWDWARIESYSVERINDTDVLVTIKPRKLRKVTST